MVNKTIYKTKFKMNKAKDIQEGNKLIAEFMGKETVKWSCERCGHDVRETPYCASEYPRSHALGGIEIELNYYTSWDWLNPAWKRFLAYADELLYKDEKYKYDTFRIYHNCVDNDNCEAAMFHLADRIKWYNIQKQPQSS